MKKLERQKQLSAQLILENFIKNTPEHIYWKDLTGVYLGCNDKQAGTLGFSSGQDVIGKTDFGLPWSKESAEEFRRNDLEVIESGQARTVEERITMDGKDMVVYSLKAPIMDAKGQIYGVLGISIDITDKKKSEERERLALIEAEKEKARAAGEADLRRASTIFAGSIAHDLRTPLTALSLHIDLLRKTCQALEEEEHQNASHANWRTKTLDFQYIEEFTHNMKKIVHEMAHFINTTLTSMQRLVSGTLEETDFIRCDIEPALMGVIEKYPFKGNEKQLIHLNIEHNFAFLGHPVLFYRIIFNLLNNAFQQIALKEHGEIFITTETTATHHVLRIKDTAGGASPEVVAHLFDGYYTTKEEGTGIGLAFCKLTMQSFGGDITSYSIEGDYMEFILSFPKMI